MTPVLPFQPAAAVPNPLPHIFDIGTISLMNGSPGAGKTALLAAILQRMNQGGELLGFQVDPTPVFYIVMDRPWRTGAQRWFDKYGFDIPHYSFVDDRQLPADYFMGRSTKSGSTVTPKQDPWDQYLKILESLGQPPGTFFSTDTLENAYGNVMDRKYVITASTAMHRYLIDHQYCQLGMMHSTKMKADPNENYANVHEQMAGTGALSGYSSTQITLLSAAQSKSKKPELHVTSHSLPGLVWQLERDKEGRYLIDEAVQLFPERLLAEDQNAAEAVYSLIPAEPDSAQRGDLVTLLESQFSRATVDRALQELLQAGRVKSSHGRYSRSRLN